MPTVIIWNGIDRETGPIRTIGAYQIAHWLRKNGYTARVIDFCPKLGAQKVAEITEKWISDETVAIGVSSAWWSQAFNGVRGRNTQSWIEPDWILTARKIVENRFPQLKWVAGGSAVEKGYHKLDWIKFQGHPEEDLIKWLDKEHSKFKIRPLFDIKTLDHRFTKEDFILPQEALPIELGRGCKFKCKFCNYPLIGKQPGTYLRDIDCIRDEIIYNYENWGTTKYFFLDDTVNEDEEKIKNLAEMAQSLPFELSWVGYNRADLIYAKPHTAQWLLDSGLKSAFFGIESFNKDASKMIGKGWSGIHGKDWLPKLQHDIWKNKVNLFCSFIVGLEPETEKDIWDTHQWCIDSKISDWTFGNLFIYSTKHHDYGKWTSIFDREHSDYGYEFPYLDQPWRWVSKNWTVETSKKLTEEVLLKSRQYRKLGGWQLLEVANLDYDVNSLMNRTYKFVRSLDFENRESKFLYNYYQKLLSI
jgi:radical SAM superfamily enzyme YgiQ (UPF0313 family)